MVLEALQRRISIKGRAHMHSGILEHGLLLLSDNQISVNVEIVKLFTAILFCVEIEDYTVAYCDRITVFEEL